MLKHQLQKLRPIRYLVDLFIFTTKLRLLQNHFKLTVLKNATFLQLRVVCMSDTHSLTPFIKFDIPLGDVFIHAGDFTKCGSLQEVIEFNTWIGNKQLFCILKIQIICNLI